MKSSFSDFLSIITDAAKGEIGKAVGGVGAILDKEGVFDSVADFVGSKFSSTDQKEEIVDDVQEKCKSSGSDSKEQASQLLDSKEETTEKAMPAKKKHRKGERNVVFLFQYKDDDGFHLVDNETDEMITLPKSKFIGNGEKFLKKGEKIKVLMDDDTVVYAEIPDMVTLIVTDIDETDCNVFDEYLATVETGAKVRVPKRIKIGDKIRVDTSIGSFERKAKA